MSARAISASSQISNDNLGASAAGFGCFSNFGSSITGNTASP
ncbi:hypothetical protein [Shewanella sp. c952]